ncbi:MAG TPA: biosynthetic peptidoglycan transglycosylase [Kofleriaceae bacterium]|jgi:hypothetical protein
MTSRLLAATALAAIGVPCGAAALVHARTADVVDHLGRAAGVPATIGGVDADLSGRVRLVDVALGSLVAADSVEASIAAGSLFSGQLGADEIRVAGPRVSIDVSPDGDSDLARLVRRLAKPASPATGVASNHASATPRLRRIVVSSGSLVAHVAGIGEVEADDVELVPDAGGVRVITGALRARGAIGDVRGELVLARSAAEVALPHVAFGRVLAVAGTGTIHAPAGVIALHDVALGRLAAGGALELRASLDDGGVERPIAAELTSPGRIVVHGDHVPLAAFGGFFPHAIGVDDAYATGTLEVARDAAAHSLSISGDGTLERVRLSHKMLGEQPITVTTAIRGALLVGPEVLALDHVGIDVGAAHWTFSGWLRHGQPMSGAVDVGLASAPCMDLLAALPIELRGPLDGMTMTGTFGAHAHVAIDLAAPLGEGVTLATELANHCDVSAEPPAADASALATSVEHTFADGSRARIGKGTPNWVELRRLPSHVPAAFVAAEDARFYDHHGFDVAQIAKSLEIDLRDRTIARGGSTISQQLVKNAFLTQRRTLDRKLQEAILTWRLEARLDKATILERYLNVIELGPHLFGLGAAAHYWFGESAGALTIRQAAFLAALTSEPHSMSRRIRRAGGLDADSRARVEVVLHGMWIAGAIDQATFEAARETPMGFAKSALGDE